MAHDDFVTLINFLTNIVNLIITGYVSVKLAQLKAQADEQHYKAQQDRRTLNDKLDTLTPPDNHS